MKNVFIWRADGSGGGANLGGRSNKSIGGRVGPMPAKTVTAEEFAAVCEAKRWISRQRPSRQSEETVVGVCVHAYDTIRCELPYRRAEVIPAEYAFRVTMHTGDFEVVEIQVMEPGGAALDGVIQANPEAIERMSGFESLMDA